MVVVSVTFSDISDEVPVRGRWYSLSLYLVHLVRPAAGAGRQGTKLGILVS